MFSQPDDPRSNPKEQQADSSFKMTLNKIASMAQSSMKQSHEKIMN